MVQLEPLLAAPAAAATAPRDAGDPSGDTPSFQDVLRGPPTSAASTGQTGNTDAGQATHGGATGSVAARNEPSAESPRPGQNPSGSVGQSSAAIAEPSQPALNQVRAPAPNEGAEAAFAHAAIDANGNAAVAGPTDKLAAADRLEKMRALLEERGGDALSTMGEALGESGEDPNRIGLVAEENYHTVPGTKANSAKTHGRVTSGKGKLAHSGNEAAAEEGAPELGPAGAHNSTRGSSQPVAGTAATDSEPDLTSGEKTGDDVKTLVDLSAEASGPRGQIALPVQLLVQHGDSGTDEASPFMPPSDGSPSRASAAVHGQAGRRGMATSAAEERADAAPSAELLADDAGNEGRVAGLRPAAQTLAGEDGSAPPSDGNELQPVGDVFELPAKLGASKPTGAEGVSPAFGDRSASGSPGSSDTAGAQVSPGTRGSAETAAAAADQVRFAQRVMHALQAAEARGGPVRLRLSPPELGAMRLELSVRDGGLQARLEVETSAARTLLLDSLPHLRERLAAQEIKIERFEVDLMNQRTGDWSQRARDQEHGGNGGYRSTRDAVERVGPTTEAAIQTPAWAWSDARIDVVI